MVTGKPKTRKSFLMGLMAASAMTHNHKLASNGQRKALYFDTEQSEYHAAQSLRRIISVAGKEYLDDISYYALRGCTAESRISIIDYIIKKTDDISLILIDGARDLVTSINDENQATQILDIFSGWTRAKNVHLVTVLHENPSSEKLRGHLGTELTNKAENVLAVELDKNSPGDTSLVYARYTRNTPIPDFSFRISEFGIPSILDSVNNNHLQHDSPEILDSLHAVLNDGSGMGHTELLENIKAGLQAKGIQIGNNKLKEWFMLYQSCGILRKEGKDRSPSAKYFLVQQ